MSSVFFLILPESSVNADLLRVGPEGLSEVNCNGHVETDQRQSQWREEDQHNGNTELTEQCASSQEEQQHEESPVHLTCNGVDSADLKELHGESDGSGAHCSGVTERRLHAGLEEGELERSILQEAGDGQSATNTTSTHCKEVLFLVAVCSGWAAFEVE